LQDKEFEVENEKSFDEQKLNETLQRLEKEIATMEKKLHLVAENRAKALRTRVEIVAVANKYEVEMHLCNIRNDVLRERAKLSLERGAVLRDEVDRLVGEYKEQKKVAKKLSVKARELTGPFNDALKEEFDQLPETIEELQEAISNQQVHMKKPRKKKQIFLYIFICIGYSSIVDFR
jgi:HPt (histidine-containing phosphotransfer) domain-containing protein